MSWDVSLTSIGTRRRPRQARLEQRLRVLGTDRDASNCSSRRPLWPHKILVGKDADSRCWSGTRHGSEHEGTA